MRLQIAGSFEALFADHANVVGVRLVHFHMFAVAERAPELTMANLTFKRFIACVQLHVYLKLIHEGKCLVAQFALNVAQMLRALVDVHCTVRFSRIIAAWVWATVVVQFNRASRWLPLSGEKLFQLRSSQMFLDFVVIEPSVIWKRLSTLLALTFLVLDVLLRVALQLVSIGEALVAVTTRVWFLAGMHLQVSHET